MIAAIYARKSTEQYGVADEQKSVARQVEHARMYATRKGWTVDDGLVFVDDGISGAEFAARPGFLRLMNALKPRPSFQVLVMSEESRLGRESIETAYALKQLVQAGVRVFFYMEDRERTLDSPTDKIMLSLTTFADELEREKARQRTYDAMLRKARAGHVTGGRVFGYDNVEVLTGDGKRSHVLRQINPTEAAIVRRIFEMSAAGTGYTRIAKELNAEGAPAPRAQRGRPSSWGPSSVHEVLRRPLYRGEIVWNRTRKRDRWGQHRQSMREGAEWLHVDAPSLRIVPEAVWLKVHERLSLIKNHLEQMSGGTIGRRARDVESHYLLPGFARCGMCGGTLGAMSRASSGKRIFVYGCLANWKRGRTVCENATTVALERVERAVLAKIGRDVLRPAVIDAVLDGVFEAMATPAISEKAAQRLRRELHAADEEMARLTAAIATGGRIDALLTALRERQDRRDRIALDLEAAAVAQAMPTVNRREVDMRVRRKLEEWRSLLTRHVQDGRQALREILEGPIRFWPIEGKRAFRFTGKADLEPIFAGVTQLPPFMASPTGFEPVF